MQTLPFEKFETVRAFREIILTIVQVNLQEVKNIELNNKMTERLVTKFRKSKYSSNGIQVSISEEQIIVKVSLNVYEKIDSIVNVLLDLQTRIYEDVRELTGCKIHQICIDVKNIIGGYE
jgi:uncharacterized alkaline shock family protein YloU